MAIIKIRSKISLDSQFNFLFLFFFGNRAYFFFLSNGSPGINSSSYFLHLEASLSLIYVPPNVPIKRSFPSQHLEDENL